MADLREDFVNYVVKALVTNPDAVNVHRATDEKGDYLELKVDPADMGKVIGKAGATAKSLRTLLRVVGAKDDLNPLPLKIVEPDGGRIDVPQQTEQVAAPTEAVEEAAPEVIDEPVVTEAPEPEDRHAATRREMEELADLDL